MNASYGPCHAHELPCDENGECVVCRAANSCTCGKCGQTILPNILTGASCMCPQYPRGEIVNPHVVEHVTEPHRAPMKIDRLATRLEELSRAVSSGKLGEFYMRIPAEPDRDADIVLMDAAAALRAVAKLIAKLDSAV